MSTPDWAEIERDYCAGQLSLRALAEKYSVSHTAIRKRAKAAGWKQVSTSRTVSTGNQRGNWKPEAVPNPEKAESTVIGNNENTGVNQR